MRSYLPRHRRVPRAGAPLLGALRLVDRVFDRVFGSRNNPLYQTGSLVVSMLVVMLVSGLYLFLLYGTHAPYESMQEIQSSAIGRFMRSMHRYSADASILLVAAHAARMFLQARNWGVRAFAWCMGLIALFLMLSAGWTGLILVWDELGLEVAQQGARIIDLLPVLPEPVRGIFIDGSGALGGSFFFANLFLHLATPTVILLAVWLHTIRLSRARWFPPKRAFFTVVGALAVLAIVWPLALEPQGRVDALPGEIAMDWYFAFFVPLVQRYGPGATMALVAGSCGFVASAVWWWRPPRAEAPQASVVDELHCRGCNQCYEDCPFEAISMVPRTVGIGSELVARVTPDRCVSCGICVGSCDVLRVGPPARDGRDVLAAVKRFAADKKLDAKTLVLAGCTNNPAVDGLDVKGARLERFPLECVGGFHLAAVEAMLKRGAAGVVIMSCAPRDCHFREGAKWMVERLEGRREAMLLKGTDKSRVLLLQQTEGELDEARAELRAFAARTCSLDDGTERRPAASAARALANVAARTVISAVIVAAVAAPSALPTGTEPDGAVLRLAWSNAGDLVDVCKVLTAEELAAIPQHMRKPQRCTRRFLDHRLVVSLDGALVVDKLVPAGGARADRPGRVLEHIPVTPGAHDLEVRYEPVRDGEGGEMRAEDLALAARLDAQRGVIHRVAYDVATEQLVVLR